MAFRSDVPVFLLTAQTFLGSTLSLASIPKLLQPGIFIDAVRAYGLLPDAIVTFFDRILPWMELAIGGTLILGADLNGMLLLIASLLFVTFALAVAIKLVQGNREMPCGCFGGVTNRLSWWVVVRNIGLAVVALSTYALSHWFRLNTFVRVSLDLSIPATLLGIGLLLVPLFAFKVVKPLWDVHSSISRLWELNDNGRTK